MHACTCHTRAATAPEQLAFDLEIGTAALAAGDLDHALHHLAGAVAEAPTSPAVDTFRRALGEQMDLDALPSDGAFYGNVAVAAMAKADAGDLDGAIGILAQVAQVRPDVGFEHLLTRWLADGTLSPSSAMHLARALSSATQGTIGVHRLHPGERALLASWAELARAFAGHDVDPMLRYPVPGILRRVGAFDEALALARSIGGQGGKIQEALTLRAQGDGEGALRAFEASGPFEDMERARCLVAMGADATSILEAHPELPEALRLLQWSGESPAGSDGVDRLDQAQRAAVSGTMDAPADATANLMRQEQMRKLTSIDTSVHGWESPSNRLFLAHRFRLPVPDVAYRMVHEPLERPLAQVRGTLTLWCRQDGAVVPAVAPPPAAVAEGVVHAMQALDPHPSSFWAASETMSAAPARHFAAAMVHPPVHADLDGPDALFRYQVMCAMGAARQPWAEARDALESAIFGPLDWASAAAIWALGERIRHDAAVAMEGRAMLLAVADDLAPLPCEPRFPALVAAFQSLPGIPQGSWAKVQAWWKDFGPTDDDDEEPPVDEEAPMVITRAPRSPPSTPTEDAPEPVDGSGLRVMWIAVVVAVLVAAAMAIWS